jgi:uncharacterized phage protein (predicted DNA packaging)
MRYLTLEQCKKHEYVEHNEDDALIESYACAAEQAVENYLEEPLEQVINEKNREAIISAMLLFFGSLYANREGFTTMNTQPTAAILALLKPYKRYGNLGG